MHVDGGLLLQRHQHERLAEVEQVLGLGDLLLEPLRRPRRDLVATKTSE